jgi:hypothetical protein
MSRSKKPFGLSATAVLRELSRSSDPMVAAWAMRLLVHGERASGVVWPGGRARDRQGGRVERRRGRGAQRK